MALHSSRRRRPDAATTKKNSASGLCWVDLGRVGGGVEKGWQGRATRLISRRTDLGSILWKTQPSFMQPEVPRQALFSFGNLSRWRKHDPRQAKFQKPEHTSHDFRLLLTGPASRAVPLFSSSPLVARHPPGSVLPRHQDRDTYRNLWYAEQLSDYELIVHRLGLLFTSPQDAWTGQRDHNPSTVELRRDISLTTGNLANGTKRLFAPHVHLNLIDKQ